MIPLLIVGIGALLLIALFNKADLKWEIGLT